MAFILRHLNNDGNRVFSKVWEGSDDEMVVSTLPPPFQEKHEVLGFCKGIFLLEYAKGRVVVWNPLSSQFTVLPPPSNMKSPLCPNSHCDGTCQVQVISRVCGIGFVPNSGDYKVVRLTSNYYHHPTEYDHASLKQAQVYSVTKDCWEEIEIDSEECSRYDVIGCATYIDGFCYWRAERTDGYKDVIASFDLANHIFSTIPIPFICNSYEYGHILMDFEGSLGFAFYQRLAVYKILYPRVRVIKDGRYQWTRDMGFKVKVQAERPLGYMRGGEVLLLEGHYCKLLMYDSISQKLSKVDQLYDHPYRMQLFPLSDNPTLPLKMECFPGLCIENTVMIETLDTSTTVGTDHLLCQLLEVKGQSTLDTSTTVERPTSYANSLGVKGQSAAEMKSD